MLVWRDLVMMERRDGVPLRRVVPRIGSVVGREACVDSGLEGSEK